MEEKIKVVLQRMYADLQTRNTSSLSLFEGEAGCALFECAYLRYAGGDPDGFEASVQRLAENGMTEALPAFCPGKSGINWFFSYLYAQELLDREGWEMLCDDDPVLSEVALVFQANGRYDFLYGSLGIAYQLLYSRGAGYGDFFSAFWEQLGKCACRDGDGFFFPAYDFPSSRPVERQVDLGLSHGLASILKFCVHCYRQHICPDQARIMGEGIVRYLLAHTNRETGYSFFPHTIDLDRPGDEPSRLAWCYGDLGISYVLLQAGQVFGDEGLTAFAERVLLRCAARTETVDTLVTDGAFCHGSAGIAHIFHRVWRQTEQPVFKQACDFWITKTLELSEGQETTPGLLEGSAGTGLVLLSYLTGDCSWDYCVLLND